MTAEDKIYLKKLGANIKKIRLEKKIKQVDLANECGFDRQNMYKIEKGFNNLTILNMRNIATALKVTIADITDFK